MYHLCLFQGYSKDLSKLVQEYISLDQIRVNLQNYTHAVHLSGTRENNMLRKVLASQFHDWGLDDINESAYKVLLSFPNWWVVSDVFV